MRRPILVSVCGIEGVGIGVACERVALSLNKSGINTVVVDLVTPKRTRQFEDDWVLGSYAHVDVVIVKRHGFTHSAVKMQLSVLNARWQDDSVLPDFAVLLTCDVDTYAQRNHIRMTTSLLCNNKDKRLVMRKFYDKLDPLHWGVDTRYIFDVSSEHGRLYAAGNILKIIKQWRDKL